MPSLNSMNKTISDIYSRALYAGFMIGFAALLSCCVENKILAALFFSLGLLYIRIQGFYLYTGQIQNIKNKTTTFKELFCGLCGNIVGVGVAVIIAMFLSIDKPLLANTYSTIVSTKWLNPWYYYVLSGICCGVLMTIATKKETPFWVSSLCVMAFILAGFNHCVADWFYIGAAPTNLLKWLCVVIGNFIGGYFVAG